MKRQEAKKAEKPKVVETLSQRLGFCGTSYLRVMSLETFLNGRFFGFGTKCLAGLNWCFLPFWGACKGDMFYFLFFGGFLS